MANKKQLKGWHVILLFIGLFMLASAGIIDFSGFMPAGRESGTDDQYPLAYPMYGVIKCDARSTVDQYQLDPSKAEIIGGDVYSWDITPYTSNFKIDNVNMVCKWPKNPAVRVINSLVDTVPHFEYLTVGSSSAAITTNWKNTLTKNVPYKIQISCVETAFKTEDLPTNPILTVSETWSFLQYYGPESSTGIPLGLETANTRYCRNQFFQDYLKEIDVSDGKTAFDNTLKSGYELPSAVYNRMNHQEVITPTVDQISLEKLNQGDRLEVDEIAAIYIYGWQTMAPIPTFTHPDTGEPLLCDAINLEMRKYQTVCVSDNNCYRLPTDRIDVDLTTFACSDSWCKNVQGLGTCFDADTFSCLPLGQCTAKPCTPELGGPECGQTMDCRITAEGSFAFGEFCNENTRVCESIDNVEVVCCDGERKGQQTCRNNKWQEDDPGVDDCPAYMCCVDDNTYFNSGTKSDEYGCSDYGTDLKCCIKGEATQGNCAYDCVVPDTDWFGNIMSGIGKSIAGALGIAGNASIWMTIAWVVLGLIGFIVVLGFAAKKGKNAVGSVMQMPVNPQTMWRGASRAAKWMNPMTPNGMGNLFNRSAVRKGHTLGKGVQAYSRFKR